jgi:DNA processing protein
VDVVYPPENRRLVDRLLDHGALVSQFPMGTPPLPAYFPARNRVISGMALGTIVVEAAEKSGALITAGFAGELGRDVFAVPGNITSRVSGGTNRLIQDGAKLVQGWEDVVAELPDVWRRLLVEPRTAASQSSEHGGNEGTILSLLGDEPVSIDHLIRESGFPSSRVSALLLELELRGLVRKAQGQCYTRAR